MAFINCLEGAAKLSKVFINSSKYPRANLARTDEYAKDAHHGIMHELKAAIADDEIQSGLNSAAAAKWG